MVPEVRGVPEMSGMPGLPGDWEILERPVEVLAVEETDHIGTGSNKILEHLEHLAHFGQEAIVDAGTSLTRPK